MINKNEKKIFAASNSYGGFYSLFEKVFNYNDYEKIFIIKGGPGTGKSTIMKKTAFYAESMGIKTERVYCSSDPSSLDGVIIEKNEKKIALLDGTSPHMFDPSVPVAIEEIINTLDGVDIFEIEKERDKISALHKEKKHCYSKAYYYLKQAGSIDNQIDGIYTENGTYNAAEVISSNVFKTLDKNNKSGSQTFKFNSCFGKNGYETYRENSINKREIHLSYPLKISQFVLSKIEKKLKDDKISHVCYLSPLEPQKIESIETDFEYIDIIQDEKTEIESFIKDDLSNLILALESAKKEALNISSHFFNQASIKHFEIEKIYSSNMNFDHNESLSNYVNRRIKQIFKI